MTKPYHYVIKPGSSGSFLCPPGHPAHSWELWGYESPRHRREMSISSIEFALTEEANASPAMRARVQKMMDEAELVASELWIRHVYGYFRNSYAPENLNRNLSNSITHNRAEIAVGAARKALAEAFEVPGQRYTTEIRPLPWLRKDGRGHSDADSYRDGSKKSMRAARRGYEVTAKADGSEVFVYALADDGSRYGALETLERYADALTSGGFTDVIIEDASGDETRFVCERVRATNPNPPEQIDPARHLAVLCVREYFPDHEPRLDLIDNPGKGYGAYPCTKCGERVQYEAKFDKLAKVTTRMDGTGMTHWTYETDCPKGGDHTTN